MGVLLLTRAWHIVDVVVCVCDVKQKPTKLAYARLLFALIGLGGNVVIAERAKWMNLQRDL